MDMWTSYDGGETYYRSVIPVPAREMTISKTFWTLKTKVMGEPNRHSASSISMAAQGALVDAIADLEATVARLKQELYEMQTDKVKPILYVSL